MPPGPHGRLARRPQLPAGHGGARLGSSAAGAAVCFNVCPEDRRWSHAIVRSRYSNPPMSTAFASGFRRSWRMRPRSPWTRWNHRWRHPLEKRPRLLRPSAPASAR